MTVKKSTAIFFAALALLVLAVIYRFSAQPKNVSREKSGEVAEVVENINQSIENKRQKNAQSSEVAAETGSVKSENELTEVKDAGTVLPQKTEENNEKKPAINFSKLVRKGAHVAEYAAFAVCFSLFFVLIDKTRSTYLIVLAVSALYSLFDEAHQFFIPGRTPKFKDIIFDMIGAVLGTAVVYICACIVKSRKKRTLQNNEK